MNLAPPHRAGHLAGACTLWAALALASPWARSVEDRPYVVVARQGEPTPSVAPGARYGILTSEPVLGAAGHVAFAGFVDSGPGNFAVWSGVPGDVRALAVTNDAAPGRPGDALDIFGVGGIRANPDGSVGFRAKLRDAGDDGIWIGAPGDLREVAIVGNQVQGLAPGSLYRGFPGFSYVCNGAGAVAVRGTISSDPETALLSGDPASPALLAGQGDPLPEAPAIRYGSLTFTEQSMNAHGVVASDVPLNTGRLDDNGSLAVGPPGAFEILFQKGDPIPGSPGSAFDSFDKPRIADDGAVVFVSDPRGSGAADLELSYFYWHPHLGLKRLATDGEPAPGAPGHAFGGLFFSRPLVASGGWAAFRSGLEPDGNFDKDAVWVARDGQAELVAKRGDAAPGLPGASFTEFGAPVLNSRGVVAFRALTNADPGIWAWDGGELRLVLTEDDRIAVPGAGVGVVQNFQMKGGCASQDGTGCSLNDRCELAVRVGFQVQLGTAVVVIPDLCDLDGDGVDCFLESALGTDCNDPQDAAAGMPHITGDGEWFVFRREADSTRFAYEVERSDDLAGWSVAPGDAALAPDQSGLPPGFERVRFATGATPEARKYLRLSVRRAPAS